MGIMKKNNNKASLFSGIVIMLMSLSGVVVCNIDPCRPILASDNDIFEFAQNFQHLSAEIFFCAATGNGTDAYDPSLAAGGPPPIGCQRANLDPQVRRIIEEFAYQEFGQIRITQNFIVGETPPRPLLDLSKRVIAAVAEAAVGPLMPPFDPYINPLNYFLTINIITYTGLVGLVGATPALLSPKDRMLFAKLLATEGGQNAVVRSYLYERANQRVVPYNITVAEFTNRTSELLNRLGKCGLKDEGIMVPRSLGAENRTESNILAADSNSLAYTRTPQELSRIVYGTGNEGVPGAFFPDGLSGRIARSFIRRRD